jgi:hypothetical protein
VTSVATVFDADTVTACIARVLQAVTDAADALPNVVTLPARQLTTTAGATWDCEMVYVSALTVQTGIPETVLTGPYGGFDTDQQGAMTVWTATVEAGIVRKIQATPTGQGRTAPAAETFTADLVNVSSDTAVLFNAALTLVARDLQPVPQSASMLASVGGMHGVAATFTVELWPGP